jgi:DNA-binding IclR family transcriptional regulator
LQDEVIGGDLTLRPENITRTARELRAQLAAIRQQGTAVMSREWPEPVTSVAAPVLGRQGAPVAALSVVTLSAHVEPAVLTPAVITVARAISRALSAAGADLPKLPEPRSTPASGR